MTSTTRLRCRYRSPESIDALCESELAQFGYLPEEPGVVNIEGFVHARFGSILDYGDLPKGILGMTFFNDGAATRILISFDLGLADDIVSERREKATIAHETGHALLHSEEARSVECLCREEDLQVDNILDAASEIQANRAIGSLLMPASLVRRVVAPYEHWLRWPHVRRQMRENLAVELSRIFEVNVAVGRIRLKQLFSEFNFRESRDIEQLSLLS